jgi:hypothetical protein
LIQLKEKYKEKNSNSYLKHFTNINIIIIVKFFLIFEIFKNYINVFTNSDSVRPLNWSNKLNDWVIYSLQERFLWNKTDNDINNKLKKDINDINMKKNQTIGKFKFFIDTFKKKIQKNKFG